MLSLFSVTASAVDESADISADNEHTTGEDTPLFNFALDFAGRNQLDIIMETPFVDGYKLDTSAFYDMLNGIDTESFNTLQWEVPTVGNEIIALNLKYELLQSNLKQLGFGETPELTIPQLDAGYSKDITQLFAEQFGDLSNKFTVHTLPDGMSMESIMAESIASRDALIKDFEESLAFDSIKGDHSIGDIFNAANNILNGAKTPTLDASDLTEKIESLTTGMEAAWKASSLEGKNNITAQYEQSLSQIGSGFKLSDEAQRAFNKLVEANQKKLNESDIKNVVADAYDAQTAVRDNTSLEDDPHSMRYPEP